MAFVDRVTIELVAGDGGNGCMSFRRERYVPRGGPDGGDGGNGGSIILEAAAGVNSLVALSNRKRWKAARGGHGEGANRHGRNAKDLILQVPPGTVVYDADQDFVLKDLAEIGDRVVAARGGRGGRGNAHFKSSTNQAPREHTSGAAGEQRRVCLELKVIADVGLIGLPNAGKSTLLSRLSKARPQIANYPFTTKFPNLGRVQIDLDHSFIMADIPGLIEGASTGAGLGHEFLRHIERAGILVHLVEPMPMDNSNPTDNYQAIRLELQQYDEALSARPEIVVVTKAELPDAGRVQHELQERVGRPVLLISAVTGQGLNALTHQIAEALQQQVERPVPKH